MAWGIMKGFFPPVLATSLSDAEKFTFIIKFVCKANSSSSPSVLRMSSLCSYSFPVQVDRMCTSFSPQWLCECPLYSALTLLSLFKLSLFRDVMLILASDFPNVWAASAQILKPSVLIINVKVLLFCQGEDAHLSLPFPFQYRKETPILCCMTCYLTLVISYSLQCTTALLCRYSPHLSWALTYMLSHNHLPTPTSNLNNLSILSLLCSED